MIILIQNRTPTWFFCYTFVMTMKLIGIIAGFLTLSTYAPQALKTIRTQKTRDLSLLTLLLLSSSALLWVVYGIVGKLAEVWVTNTIVLILALIILTIKIRNDRKLARGHGLFFYG